MDLKSALLQLKKVGPAVKLQFLYIEADAKGKPVVLVGNSIATEKDKVLKTAKVKHTATGKMALSVGGELSLQARGDGMATLKANMTKAVKVAGSVVKSVVLGAPEPEEAPAAPAAAAPAAPAPAQPAPNAWKTAAAPSGPGRGFSMNSQRGAAQPATGAPQPAAAIPQPVTAAAPQPAADAPQRYLANVLEDEDDEGEEQEAPGDGATAPANRTNYIEAIDLSRSPNYVDTTGANKPDPAKKFPDASPKTPEREEIDRLSERRSDLRHFIDSEAGKPEHNRNPQKIAQHQAELATLEKDLRAKLVKLNETGFARRAMRPEYADEDKKVGWQAEAFKPKPLEIDPDATPEEARLATLQHGKAMADWERFKEGAGTVRKNFSEDEKAESELTVDDEGKIRDADGDKLTTGGGTEYVVDADDGQMHQFEASREKTGVKAPGPRGNLVTQQERVHHTSVLSGADVAGAGAISVQDGEITNINNLSGHYKPGAGQMLQTVETLLKQGALLDKTWVDKEGLELTGKMAELLAGTKKLQKKVAAALEQDPAANVKNDREKIDAALKMLGKMGAGPANAIRDNVKVGMLDGSTKLTGAQIKEATEWVDQRAIPAEDFLRTGGGNEKQAGLKTAAQEEMVSQMRRDRADLKEHTKTGVGAADPTEAQMDDQIDRLAGKLKPPAAKASPAGAPSVAK